MPARAGTAFIEVRGDWSPFDKQVGRLAVTSRSRFAKIGRGAAAGVTAGFAAGAVVVRRSLGEWVEGEKVGRQTGAVLRSTGREANVTARQIENLATSISRKAGIDDEAIQSAENVLLTFTKVRNETGRGNRIFDQATRAVVDLSARFDQDLKGSAIQVGRALNDPIKGVTALQRVGVSFTEQQRDRITRLVESNRTLAAQKVILRELRVQSRGAAAAEATGFDRAKVAIDNIAESLGGFLGPRLEQAANQVAKFVNQIQTGRGAGGEFARQVKQIWANAQPVVVAFGRAAAAVARFAAQHPNITKVATAVGLTALAFNKFKIAGAISAISSVVKITGAMPGRIQNAMAGARALVGRLFGRAGVAGGTALAENAAAAAAANVPGRFTRKAGVFRNAGMALGRGTGIAAGASMATHGADQIATTMERSTKRGQLARAAKIAGRAVGGLIAPALAGVIAQMVLRELNKRVDEWARREFGGAGSAYADSKGFLGRNLPETFPGGPLIREIFKRRGGVVGRARVVPTIASPARDHERPSVRTEGSPRVETSRRFAPVVWASLSADTARPPRQLWHPIRTSPLPRFRAGGIIPAPIGFPLLGNMLDPLTDDALLGGIQAGMDRTGRRGRRLLLAQLLEAIAAESGDRATRRRPTRRTRVHVGRRGAAGRIRPGGGYAGTEAIVKTAVAGFPVTSYKRTPAENAAAGGSPTSDHLTTETKAYAADYTAGDGPFNTVKRRLRIPARPGTWTRHKIPGLRYVAQMLWKVEDHHDHNHLGVERMRRGGIVGPGFDFTRWLRGLRKRDREPTLAQLVSILGADQLVSRNADLTTRTLSERVAGRSIGSLVGTQQRIKRQIRRMARQGFTGPERIRTRRLRGALTLLQDEMGRPIGRQLGASDRLQERLAREQATAPDRLIVSGVEPESVQGLEVQRTETVSAVGRLEQRRAGLTRALRRAKRTGNRQAVEQVQTEIREVDDQILGLKSSIAQLTKSIQEMAPTATDFANRDLALAQLTDTLDDDRAALQNLEAIAQQQLQAALQTADPRDDIEAANNLRGIRDQLEGVAASMEDGQTRLLRALEAKNRTQRELLELTRRQEPELRAITMALWSGAPPNSLVAT